MWNHRICSPESTRVHGRVEEEVVPGPLPLSRANSDRKVH